MFKGEFLRMVTGNLQKLKELVRPIEIARMVGFPAIFARIFRRKSGD
jgi:hypothetical protein